MTKKNLNSLYDLSDLSSNNQVGIARIYNIYKQEFIFFLQNRYKMNQTILADIYQESFMAAYENIKNGKYKQGNSSFKTYLFTIGRNLALNYIRGNKISTTDIDVFNSLEEQATSDEWQQIQEIVFTIVDKLKEPCNTVLKLFFWEKKGHKEIADTMGYKNSDVAKQRKNLCMGELRKVVKKKLNEEGFA